MENAEKIKLFKALVSVWLTLWVYTMLLIISFLFVNAYINKDLYTMIFTIGTFLILTKVDSFTHGLLYSIVENLKED